MGLSSLGCVFPVLAELILCYFPTKSGFLNCYFEGISDLAFLHEATYLSCSHCITLAPSDDLGPEHCLFQQ